MTEEVLETLRNSDDPNNQDALKDIQNGQPTVVYYLEFVKGDNDGFRMEVRSESFNMEPKCYVLKGILNEPPVSKPAPIIYQSHYQQKN
jgi:hypothetical protein